MSLRKIATRLSSLEIWVVALAAAASLASARFLPAALAAAAAFWFIRWLAYCRFSQRTPADWMAFLLALTLPVTLWATALPEITIPQVYRLLFGLALCYAIVNWTSLPAPAPARLQLLAAGLVLVGLGLALTSPITVNWPAGKLAFLPESLYSRFRLLVTDTVHPNVLAGSLALLLPLGASQVLFSAGPRGWLFRMSAGVACLGMLGVLVLTQSRGAWMAVGAASLLLVMLRWRYGWLLPVLATTAAVVVALRLGMAPLLEALAYSNTVGTVEGRLEIWSRAIYMIQDFPFTGIGMGSFGPVADTLYPFFLASPGSVPHAHNLFLQVAVDLGLPGLVAWIGTWTIASLAAWQLYRSGQKAEDRWLAGLGAGLLGSQLALIVHGLTDAVTWGMVRPAPFVWAVWGLALAGQVILIEQLLVTKQIVIRFTGLRTG